MVDIKRLTVNTDDERKQWVQMLVDIKDYHYDMADRFESEEIIGDTDMDKVVIIHRAWAKAILDAVDLIDMWQIEEEDEIKRVDG
jgi:hypothetical protein